MFPCADRDICVTTCFMATFFPILDRSNRVPTGFNPHPLIKLSCIFMVFPLAPMMTHT